MSSPNTQDITISARYRCSQCESMESSEAAIRRHITVEHAEHIRSMVKHLSYEEIRRECDIDLPEKIYQCPLCEFCCDGTEHHATTTITRHVEKVHDESPRFQRVEDVDKIRESFIPDLPYVCKCRVCSQRLKDNRLQTIFAHVITNHPERAYSMC